ncbi:calcium:proton antiporter [Microbispora sp. ATCC PTA-5024]|uniref:calcium:proton antiporter n=1 Tax=Microbispora sp. ATCC PTA-5024 TaxID=316330 RepID=UPI0003DC4B82|nr:sodium:proton exchanger [Microbispora sp. ATCC PTA-5024]ETK32730.1 sodium/hydrogen exchanger [Microbispora sp. ATCC PTA-5024]
MVFTRGDWRLIILCVTAAAGAAVTRFAGGGPVLPFVVSGIALAVLASLVGRSVEALGDRLGAGATGVVQSALGNLPELFVVLFALRDGLYGVASASIVGSILANVLLVLGLAFVVGGVRHGPQRFGAESARTNSLLLVLAVFALLVPALTAALHTPAAGHERGLSIVVSVLLLGLFAASLPAAIRRRTATPATTGTPATPGTLAAAGTQGIPGAEAAKPAGTPEVAGEPEAAAPGHQGPRWPLGVALAMLAVTGVGAAFVSEWFVEALQPAMDTLGISQAFAGLVIVAIAGNAVENVVGIQLAARNQADFALSVILQSPLQIALVVAPALVLLSPLVGASFTLVLPPLLIAALVIAVLVTVIVVLDGESTWLEGATLIVLYCVIAAAFWWG